MGPIRLDRREDGTISSAWQEVTETATLPSGREVSETRWEQIELADLDTLLGSAYADLAAHNAALEAQIQSERDAAVATLAARDATIDDLRAQISA